MAFEDSFRHQGLRKKLLDELRRKGIRSEVVLEAMNKVPRHWFMDSAFLERAYDDTAFPIGEGQTISQPFTVAFMTELLEIKRREKVLEIGTGSGYQAAVLSTLGAKVFSIERNAVLFKRTRQFLAAANFMNVNCYLGDGTLGLPQFAPFDKIIVTAGGPVIPASLREQLAIGGIMAIPVGDREVQKMFKITRLTQDEYRTEELSDFRFVPLLGEEGW